MWNLFKINNKDTKTTPLALLLNLNIFTPRSSVFLVNVGQANAGWEGGIWSNNCFVYSTPSMTCLLQDSKIYLFKANNGNVWNMLKVSIYHWRRSGFSILHCSSFTHYSGVSTVELEQVNVVWFAPRPKHLYFLALISSSSPKILQAHCRVMWKEGRRIVRSPVNIYDGEFCYNN